MKYEGIYEVLDNEEYHSTKDQSSTNFRDFMNWCGEGAMENKTKSKKQTKEMLEGELIHHKIEFKEHETQFAVAPEVDRRTKDGKTKFAEFEAGLGHRKAISQVQLDMANDCMDRVWEDSSARLFLENGKMERSGFCEIMGLPVKARPDIDCSHVPASEHFPCLVDIKTRKNKYADKAVILNTGLVRIGPDLSNSASREPTNNSQWLSRYLKDSSSVRDTIPHPSYDFLTQEDFDSLITYLLSLGGSDE